MGKRKHKLLCCGLLCAPTINMWPLGLLNFVALVAMSALWNAQYHGAHCFSHSVAAHKSAHPRYSAATGATATTRTNHNLRAKPTLGSEADVYAQPSCQHEPPTADVEDALRMDEETTSLSTIQKGQLTEAMMKFGVTSGGVYDAKDTNSREQYILMGLLWSIAVISALDRVAMSVALVPMSNEFGFSDTIKGSISSLFSIGYGFAILPVGILLSTLSPRKVMTFGIVLWSLATVATPTAAQLLEADILAPLLFVRACVGVGEAMVIPTTQRLLAVWTSAGQKGLAIAFVFFGFQVGNVAAYCLSPMVMDALGGWRGLFFAYGTAGLILLVPWQLLAKDAPNISGSRSSNLTTPQNLSLTTDAVPAAQPAISIGESLRGFMDAPWKDFARSKGAWGMLLAHSAKNWGLYNSLAWTPTFYAEQYGLDVHDSALLSVLPAIAGASCGLIAGGLSDSLIRNIGDDFMDESRTTVRKYFQAVGLLGPALALGLLAWNIPEEAFTAQVFLTVAVGLQSFNAGGFESGNQDKAGPRWAGLLYSVTSLPSVIVGTFGVWATGRVLDVTHQDWSYVFSINACINVLGALAFILLFDSRREFE